VADATFLIASAAVAYGCGRFLAPLLGGAICVGILAIVIAIGGGDGVVPGILVSSVPWAAGAAIRSRHSLLDALRSRNAELEAERDSLARLSVQRERARIARELHDIVAHHLAVIVVQAGAGRMSPDSPEGATERFSRIRQSGEQALSEMERLVDLLQTDRGQAEPRIDVLIDQAEAAGLRLSASGPPPELSLTPEAENLAYRIVQEGLTNAMKHAPGSEVRVRIAARGDELEIELRNWGGEQPSGLARTGSGLGLRGLRERLQALGGHLDAAPDGDGWRLRAALPLS
jgi:signal transduction histidine kinase